MTAMNSNRFFPLHFWLLTTIIVGPILLSLGSALYNSNYFDNSANIGVIFLYIPFGLFFSLPTFLIVWLTYSILGQKLPPILMKLLLISLAVIGVLVTFSLIGGSTANANSLVYSIAVVLSGLMLRLKKS